MARTAMSLACVQLGLVGDEILRALEVQPGGIPPHVMARMESGSFIPSDLIAQVFNHKAFKEAVTEVSRVRYLRPVLHREGRPGPLVGAGGTMSVLQPENIALSLIAAAIEYFAVEGKRPSTEELQARLLTSAEELQAGLAGSHIPLRRVIGFADCPLADDCSIVTPWGEVRRASGRLAELTLGDRTANAVMVTDYEGRLDVIPQGSPPARTMIQAELDFNTRWYTLLPLSVILGCGGDGLIAPTPVWQRIVSCISGTGGMSGWIPQSRFGAVRQTPLHADECVSIGAWAERLEMLFDERYLGVAARRIIRAVSSTADSEARLIDSVTAWEALVGTGTEVTFRITAGMAALLTEHASARLNIAKRLRRIYRARSKVVHGEIVDPNELQAASSSAVQDAVVAFRNLLLDHDDLIELSSEARSDALIFGS